MKKNKKLGRWATDKITGFRGRVTGFVQYITGCDQYCLTPPCQPGKEHEIPKGTYFDENRLDFDKAEDMVQVDTTKKQGPMEPPEAK